MKKLTFTSILIFYFFSCFSQTNPVPLNEFCYSENKETFWSQINYSAKQVLLNFISENRIDTLSCQVLPKKFLFSSDLKKSYSNGNVKYFSWSKMQNEVEVNSFVQTTDSTISTNKLIIVYYIDKDSEFEFLNLYCYK